MLQRRNAHQNSNVSRDLSTISIGSFRAASERIHDAVMAEFGDSVVNGNAEAEASREGAEPRMTAGMSEDGIEQEEFQSRTQGVEITDA